MTSGGECPYLCILGISPESEAWVHFSVLHLLFFSFPFTGMPVVTF